MHFQQILCMLRKWLFDVITISAWAFSSSLKINCKNDSSIDFVGQETFCWCDTGSPSHISHCLVLSPQQKFLDTSGVFQLHLLHHSIMTIIEEIGLHSKKECKLSIPEQISYQYPKMIFCTCENNVPNYQQKAIKWFKNRKLILAETYEIVPIILWSL